jgi:alpha-glucosidase
VDFATEHGLDYVHFDTGWYGSEFSPDADPKTVAQGKVRKYPFRDDSLLVDLDMPQVIDYASSHDIGVILYVNHVGLENYDLDELFAVYEEWGISGVKFGFVNVGPQKWTNWLHDAVRSAAKHQLIVDIHDQYRPTGFSRTYPNLLTQEGIGGDEEWPGPEHELILPFTRFVAGAADHTFTFYSPQMKKTHSFQLAATVVYFSPLQYLFWYDSPDEYDGNPGLKFWEIVPTTWDETRVIHGKIGEYITVARRHGDEWFVGTLSDSTETNLNIPLNFLNSSKNYTAEIFTDHPDGSLANYPVPVIISQKRVHSEDALQVQLIPGGGHAVHLTPIEE